MSKPRKYTSQFSVVATDTQARLILEVSERILDGKAFVARAALDAYCGLVDGEVAPGETLQDVVDRTVARLQETGARQPDAVV